MSPVGDSEISGCSEGDGSHAEHYDDVLDALQWNYLQSVDWLCKLERSNRVGVLE